MYLKYFCLYCDHKYISSICCEAVQQTSFPSTKTAELNYQSLFDIELVPGRVVESLDLLDLLALSCVTN
jgi:hypothetical protein